MQTILFMFTNDDDKEFCSAGNLAYMKSVQKACKQLICCMTIEQTEEERAEWAEMEQEEITEVIADIMFENPEMLYFPS